MTLQLVLFIGLVVLVGVAGVAIGILLIGPRLNRWVDRDDEEADGRSD
jgi:hypothetical protein